MIKKSFVFLFCIIFLFSLVSAKMEISTIPEDKRLEPGQSIQIKVTLYDSENKLINDEVSITLEDVTQTILKETTIQSNSPPQKIELTKNAVAGTGKIIARYKDEEIIENLIILESESAKFELEEQNLIITNNGNTKYSKTIHITIGTTTGTQNPNLNIGESVSYRLIAPEGVYNIKVSEGDGGVVLERSNVGLTGTGNVIGALDERITERSGITGGISPDEDSGMLGYVKNNKFAYVFVTVIFGGMILLAIERRYKKGK